MILFYREFHRLWYPTRNLSSLESPSDPMLGLHTKPCLSSGFFLGFFREHCPVVEPFHLVTGQSEHFSCGLTFAPDSNKLCFWNFTPIGATPSVSQVLFQAFNPKCNRFTEFSLVLFQDFPLLLSLFANYQIGRESKLKNE